MINDIDRFQKGVKFGIIFLIAVKIVAVIALVYIAVKAITHIEKHGAKNVIERIWDGPKQ